MKLLDGMNECTAGGGAIRGEKKNNNIQHLSLCTIGINISAGSTYTTGKVERKWQVEEKIKVEARLRLMPMRRYF